MTEIDALGAQLRTLPGGLLADLQENLRLGTIGPEDAVYVIAARLGANAPAAARVARSFRVAVGLTGDPESARWLLVGLAAAKAHIVEPSLVWTSPAADARARDTGAVLRERIAKAAKSIIVVGYSVTSGADAVLEDLGMASGRGVSVALVADRLDQKLDLIRKRWPSGAPRPDLWTRDANEVDPMSALHAKVIVFDDDWLLVSSANLTQHGLRDNLELGVLLHGAIAGQARELVQQWIAAGLLRSLRQAW